MSKEIRRGRSQEFAGAVRSLLGLSAYTSALTHLNGRGNTTVLKAYEDSYDEKSDITVKPPRTYSTAAMNQSSCLH